MTTTVAVIGGTGNVGSEVVRQLAEAGASPRAWSRRSTPPVDLRAPATLEALEAADAAFLVWPFEVSDGARAAVQALAARVPRIVYLSAISPPGGVWEELEAEITRTGAEFTFLRPSGFAANTLGWAGSIRREGVVRWPYGAAARSLIHERDIAAVAVKVLLEDGHGGATYLLTGPKAITQTEQVRLIGAAIGRSLSWEELSPEEARPMLTELFGNEDFAAAVLPHWATLVDSPEVVTDTVEKLLGRPATPFAQWAEDHAADFS